jgi:ABC-type transport system involved in cytochrome c biogenesis ATPase subunit
MLMSFNQRLLEDRESFKKHVSDSSIVQEIIELMEKLGGKDAKTFNMSLRIKNGSFKVVERVDENAANKTDLQRIESVFNGAPIQSWFQTLKRRMTCKGDGANMVERFPMQNVNLVFEQGKTHLVLGAPRSGKSLLLRMIAGILPEDDGREVGGSVTINKFGPKTKGVVWSNFVGYIDQIDRLHAYLTVKETCEFAWRCRSGGTHRTPLVAKGPEVDAEIDKLDKALFTVMTALRGVGLTRVQDTFVGDQQTVRGVSGGEKKRVTVAEMQVGTYPIMCMDEISTGLDGPYKLCSFRILLSFVDTIYVSLARSVVQLQQPSTFASFSVKRQNCREASKLFLCFSRPLKHLLYLTI